MAIDRQNIKDKFRSEENLPQEFSWENMELGIQEKMDSKKSVKSTWFISITAIALALFIVTLGIFYLFNDHNEVVAKNDKNTHNIDLSSPGLSQSNTIENNITQNSERAGVTHTKVSKIEKKYSVNYPNGSTEWTLTREIKTKATISNKQKENDNEFSLVQEERKNDITEKSKASNTNLLSDSNQPSYNDKNNDSTNKIMLNNAVDVSNVLQESNLKLESESKTNNENSEFLIMTSPIETKLFTVIHHKALELHSLAIIHSPIVKKKETSYFKNSISFTGGIWKAFSHYDNSTLGAIKSTYEKDALSYGMGIGYNRMISNSMYLTTGLEWNSLRNILDYRETTNYAEERENLLLSMDINTITGDTIKNYGTGIVTGKKTRTVINNNTQKVLSIPVLLSYMVQKNRFYYTFGLGPVLHYNLSAEGRTIARIDQFLSYDKTYFKTITYGLIAKLGAKYSLSERYLIGLDVSYSAPLSKWNADSNFSLKRSMPGTQISITYRF